MVSVCLSTEGPAKLVLLWQMADFWGCPVMKATQTPLEIYALHGATELSLKLPVELDYHKSNRY